MTRLLYHGAADAIGKESPFDVAVLCVAEFWPLRIVCLHIGVNYIQRATWLVPEWRIVSDVEEWLSALSTADSTEKHLLAETPSALRLVAILFKSRLQAKITSKPLYNGRFSHQVAAQNLRQPSPRSAMACKRKSLI